MVVEHTLPYDSILLFFQQAAELLSGHIQQPFYFTLGPFEVLNAECVDRHLPDAQVPTPVQSLRREKTRS